MIGKEHTRPLVERTAVIEKFSGKGGWTYISIPEASSKLGEPFGWLRVNGRINDYFFEQGLLQSMGNGMLFLPIKASIRKLLKKGVGDEVYIVLHEADDMTTEIPEELKLCLLDVPLAYERFKVLSETEKRQKIAWIYSVKKEETKIERIIKLIDQLLLKR
ncbi:MAG: YdeI/OmpD-associated family protein [Sphingobacterium sp.]|jgi:hypothetical protein|uniref:YdeI/OmpD-associated family protein n=1 Tax=Sphingobacterium sp. TaxID=341027 RepID=UPI00283F84B5|nr:YdeI/OmpD-associated family protein [Sphingobacterium sp.]MDR3008416.1 YdeI/OmpD-associated family protein [Sphingobacterium sp.]